MKQGSKIAGWGALVGGGKPARASAAVCLFAGLSACVCPLPEPAFGQGTPLVVTLIDGLEFEGMAGSTEQVSNSLDNPMPYQSRPIARIDDGLRIVYLHRDRMVANVRDSERRETKISVWQRTTSAGSDGFGQLVSVGPFDEAGHRMLTVASADGRIQTIVQGITELTPRYAHVQALLGGDGKTERWAMRIATGTIPADVLQSLLRGRIMSPDEPGEYLQNVTFYTQAQRYTEAIGELDFARSRFPDLKEKFDQALADLRQAWGRQILDEVRLRRQSGQTQLALQLAQAINKEGLANRIGLDFEQEIASITGDQIDAEQLRELLLADMQAALAASQTPEEQAMLTELMDEFREQIDPVSALRLAAWRQRRADPQFTPQQRIGLAISGWIVGSSAALENYATAQSLVVVRRLVREYLGAADAARRAAILEELARLEGSDPDLLVAMIRQMEPPHAPDPGELTGAEPHRFTVTIPGTLAQGELPQKVHCCAFVPPGYSVWRRYPMLLVLPPATRSAEQFLDYWCGGWNPRLGVREGQALRHGFVVVGVDWRTFGQDRFGGSAQEHAAILAALRESLRRFAVDSDRVVIAGMGAGAEGASDVAFSHPDLFAGVAAISGPMSRYAEYYSRNIHPPFCLYSVVGQRDSQSIPPSLDVWNLLLSNRRHNKAIVVQYQGRLAEAFPEELPQLLRWALLQRRYWPNRADEINVEFKTLRDWDNRFWFYELRGLDRTRLMLPEEWRDKDRPNPVQISVARRANSPNVFTLGPSQGGADEAVLWLSSEFVNFEEEVEIRGRGRFRQFVKPSRQTLLEDVRQRGDRQHPCTVKIVESNRSWQVRE